VFSCALASAYEGVDVVATDLPCVLPLMHANAARGGGRVRAQSLPWGVDTALRADVVLCCECLYWGGWDLLQDDTRAPLRRTLGQLAGPHTIVFLAFTVRDAARELGFVRSLLAEDGFACRCAAAPSHVLVPGRAEKPPAHVSRNAVCFANARRHAPASVALDDAHEGDVLLLALTR
jgi:hypothetical protein